MEAHPEKSLRDLMNMENAQALFKNSKYKPQNR